MLHPANSVLPTTEHGRPGSVSRRKHASACFGKSTTASEITIIIQTWGKCVFKFQPGQSSTSRYKEPVVIHLETAAEGIVTQFDLTANIQTLASRLLPSLVPSVLQVVVEFIDGFTVDSVWAEVNDRSKTLVLQDIIEALKLLHATNGHDQSVQYVLKQSTTWQDEAVLPILRCFGGAHTTILTRGESLLYAIMERRKLDTPFCDTQKDPELQGIMLTSKFSELGSVFITQNDMNQWVQEAVLGHNDLTPRNLLLKTI
ncbi:hypothetical protein PWT90_06059 [Aphanocladium album]|nr:hypothetical protein PWT90_06059 [Aphanocladium album]